MLTGAGLANVSSADADNKVKVPVNFELPIKKGGKVEIDLETAGDDHDIYIDDDEFPVYGMILDNAGAPVVYCDLNTDGIEGVEPNCNVYVITKDNKLILTFAGASKYVGKTMLVDCYAEKAGGVTEINIDAENFAGNYYVEAKTFFREEYTAKDMPVVITLPNVKIQSNFTFTMANSGDPSTFTFTMDCFPAYVKGNHTSKVFASIDMIADENIHPDVEDETEDDSCAELTIPIVKVSAGAESDTLVGGTRKLSTLGNSLTASVDRANIDFGGNLNRIDNWTEFSTDEDELTGYYFPFVIYTSTEATLVRYDASGEIVSAAINTADGDLFKAEVILAVNEDEPVTTAWLTTSTVGDDYDPTTDDAAEEISLDFCKVVFK